MRLVAIAVIWYLAGQAAHLIYGNNSAWYANLYYIWNNGKELLLCLSVFYLIPKDHRWIIKPVIIYSIFRFIWEIVNLTTDTGINHPQAVKVSFTLLLTGVIILLIKDLRQRKRRWEQNS